MAVTGGSISTSKSWWYLVDYTWHRGKWIAVDANQDLDLVATSADGTPVSLRRLYASEASEMLGILVAPDGNTSALVDHLRTEASLWGAKVLSGHPSRLEAWQALHSNITAKLRYPLPACSLSEHECKSILYPAIKAALPKAGIASNLVSNIRDAPLNIGGVGVVSLYHHQGTIRTSMLVEQVFKKQPPGSYY